MDLFDYMRENTQKQEAPLASRLRPRTLDEIVGQKHILGKDKLLYRAIRADKLSSLIFYGPPGRGKTTLALLPAALAGGLAGFLIYNFHPAKVFMGDTGSLFLGGMVCGLAFALDMPLVLILVGIIYIIETVSVIMQVTYFKLTHGKRIFRMTPIHHHFEMGGWSEVKIFTVFTGITVVMCILAFLGVRAR